MCFKVTQEEGQGHARRKQPDPGERVTGPVPVSLSLHSCDHTCRDMTAEDRGLRTQQRRARLSRCCGRRVSCWD